MVAALHGRRAAHKADAKRELLLAYNTGAFAGIAFAGKLKSFDEYAREPDAGHRLENARAIHFFHALKARGVPIEITRTVN
jgi:hypothetical protein